MTTLSKCPYCKKELSNKSNICPHCWGVLFEVVWHKKEIPNVDVNRTKNFNNQYYRDEKQRYTSWSNNSWDLYDRIKKSWNATSPIVKFIGFIILLVIIHIDLTYLILLLNHARQFW